MLVRVRDLDGHVLAVHLHNLLRLFGEKALKATWQITPVELSNGELWFEVFGPASQEMVRLSDERKKISGEHLYDLSRKAIQIIWGQFYASMKNNDIFLIIKAVDSSFYEIETRDQDIIKIINDHYSNVEIVN